MADIDVLVAVNNAEANAALRRTAAEARAVGDAAGEGADEAAGAFGKMAEKFGHMSRGLSVVSPQMAMLARETRFLTMLADPVALAAVAVVGLAFGFYKLAESGRAVEELKLKEHLELVKKEAEGAAKAFETYADAIAKGKTAQEALLESSVAFSDAFFNIRKAQLSKQMSEDQQQIIHLGEALRAEYSKMENAPLNQMGKRSGFYFDARLIEDSETELAKLTARQDENGASLRALGEDVKAGHQAIADATSKTKKNTEAVAENAWATRLWTGFKHDANKEMQEWIRLGEEERQLASVGKDINTGMDPEQTKKIQADFIFNNESALDKAKDQWSAFGDHVQKVVVDQLANYSFGVYENALESLFRTTKEGNALSIKSFEALTHGILHSLGMQAVQQGLFDEIMAIEALAKFYFAPELNPTALSSAAMYAEAGGAMLALGAALGAGSAATSGGGSGGGGGGGSGGGSSGGGITGTPTGGDSSGGGLVVNVTVIGTLDSQQAADLSNQIQQAQIQQRLI